MVELEQKINQQDPAEAAGKIESKPITDEEILKANGLFKRKESKENPLDENEEKQLVDLTAKREEEYNLVFPKFSYWEIYGFEGGTPSDESDRQYKVAINFYESIIKMGGDPNDKKDMEEKRGAIKKFALRLEKLQDWNHDPEWINKRFDIIFNKKKEKLEEIIEKSKSGEPGEFIVTKKGTKRKRLPVIAFVPEYRREGVIYLPQPVKLAAEWRRDLINTYRDGGKRRDLGKSLRIRA